MITIQTVADAAKVSTTTVSHVINKTRKVSPETERAVLEAIERVGYSPNHLARSLAGGATRTVGVAIAALSNHYFASVVHSIEAECARRGLMMLLADTHEDPAHELNVVRALHERRVDGILLAPTADPERRALGYLRDRAVPTVLVDRFIDRGFDQIAVEGRKAARLLVQHVVELGHRRIAFISGAPGLSTTQERLEGYQEALQAGGLEFDPALVESGESLVAPAAVAVRKVLALKSPPTAIVTANNLMTLGALRALRDAKLRVPDDVSLAAFDDVDWAEVFSPPLTVIAQPVESLGAKAVELLAQRIQDPNGKRKTVRLTPELRVRESAVRR